jgi:hypothetical protein
VWVEFHHWPIKRVQIVDLQGLRWLVTKHAQNWRYSQKSMFTATEWPTDMCLVEVAHIFVALGCYRCAHSQTGVLSKLDDCRHSHTATKSIQIGEEPISEYLDIFLPVVLQNITRISTTISV